MTPLPERRAMIDDQLALSKSAQCRLLGLNRSGIYYENRGESSLNLELMRLMDEHYIVSVHLVRKDHLVRR